MFSQLTICDETLTQDISISKSAKFQHPHGSLLWQVRGQTSCINITSKSLNHQDTSNHKGKSIYACIILTIISPTLALDHIDVLLRFQFWQWWVNKTAHGQVLEENEPLQPKDKLLQHNRA